MAYTEFDESSPDPTTQTLGEAMSADRANQLALRDAHVAMSGFFPGWDGAAQSILGGSPNNPAQPGQFLYSKGTERVRVRPTYEAGTGLVTAVVIAYSANSGTSYDTVGTAAITYDEDGNWTSTTWS